MTKLISDDFNPNGSRLVKFPKGQLYFPPDEGKRANPVADCCTRELADQLAISYNQLPLIKVQLQQTQAMLAAEQKKHQAFLLSTQKLLATVLGNLESQASNNPDQAFLINSIAENVRVEAMKVGIQSE